MSEQRYFKIEYDDEWYLFDSTTISEQFLKEQAEYEFALWDNSLSPLEIVDLLNELDDLQKENEQLRKELNGCEEFRYAVFEKMEELDKKLEELE